MRHLKSGKTLGVKPPHKRAMLRNLVTSLIEREQIKTTVTRAKELRKPLDNMITLGKRGDLSARRRALGFIKSKEAMAKLFGDLAERYQDRPGGFSRILKLGPRRGDGAEMAQVILVGSPDDPFAEVKKPARRGKKKPKAVLDEVAEEVRAEGQAEPPSEQAAPSSKKAAAQADAANEEAGKDDAASSGETKEDAPAAAAPEEEPEAEK